MISPDEESQILGKALASAKSYADLILKGPLEELGGILSDTVAHWRLKNQVRLMLKAKEWLERKGVNPKKVMPETFIPLLEDGSNVEDETLADMFASLLANHLDPKQDEFIHPSYTKVLSQISSLDARAMMEFRIWVSHQEAREIGLRGSGVTVTHIAKQLLISNRKAYLSCLNLSRLGIIEADGYLPPDNHPIPLLFQHSAENQKYRMTEYGVAFYDACQYVK